MTTKPNPNTNRTRLMSRRLVSWPLALIGLTLAFLFVAKTVSAWGRGGGHDIEDIKSHAEHFVDRALDQLDATEEQSAAVQLIVMATIDDLQNARGDAKQGREEFRGLITADSIDREAFEQVRLSHMKRADEMSRIVADGLADIMDVLTPEQRQALEAHFDEHHGRHGGRGWGWH
jgi:Spy/CpxP family protein refolding chaperone